MYTGVWENIHTNTHHAGEAIDTFGERSAVGDGLRHVDLSPVRCPRQ